MTAAEFGVWFAEYNRSPWGEERSALNFAIIAKTVADYAGKIRKGGPSKLSDFILDFERATKPDEVIIEADAFEHFGKYH
jgi:hypothetical protein